MATQRTFTADEAQKKFQALPSAVQDMLYSTELTAIIQKVGEKNKLHYDQMGRLEIETHNVLLGFTDTGDFASILEKVLEVDHGVSRIIADDMNEMLFSKLRESMKQATTDAQMPEKDSNPPAMSAAPLAGEKSVVMPSAAKAPVPAATPEPVQPVAPSSAHADTSSAMHTIPAIEKPSVTPAIPHVDAMLSQPTVSLAPKPATDITKSDAPKPPANYKADPYHEPIE